MSLPKFILLGLLLSLIACNSYSAKDQGNEEPVVSSALVPDFATIRDSILTPYCIKCHSTSSGNAGGINVETYLNVHENISKIASTTIGAATMPPGTPLSAGLQTLLQTWIANGSPEHVDGVANIPALPVETPSTQVSTPAQVLTDFNSLSKNIFIPKCSACHGGTNGTFKSYSSLMSSGWLVAGNINDSSLYKKIKDNSMPPGAPLPEDEIENVAAWISSGATDN